MKLKDPGKFYRAFSVAENSNVLKIFLEETDKTLMELWEEELSSFSDVNVFLSGGIDSQFVLHLLSKLGKNITVYIFSWLWDDCVINSADVIHATRYCNKFGYSYKTIEIDYKQFLHTNQHLSICKQYHASSPQISLQLKMLDFVDNDNPIFLGGDPPIINYNLLNKKSSVWGLDYQVYMTNAFLRYSVANKKIVIKDLFKISPEISWLSHKLFVEVTKKHKVVYPEFTGELVSHQPIRKLFYQELGTELLLPLLKNTGFETLKVHLAKESGIYNQYDMLYRYPLLKALERETWYSTAPKAKFMNSELIKQIVDEHNKFCTESVDFTVIENYNFNL